MKILKFTKRLISVMLVISIIAAITLISVFSSAASGTGTGLAEWALNAYYSHWSYVYGGSTPGTVDCSGLIYSYTGAERGGDDQLYASSESGSVSAGIPNIHGLGLWQEDHVGVYVGGSDAVDARGDEYGVCYESAYSHDWVLWFKVNGVSYPSDGWEEFNGNYYYYQNGEYVTDTTLTIGGETYSFDSDGICGEKVSDTSSTADNDSQDTEEKSSVLKKGSTGTQVEKMQERLSELGYYTGSVDGDFGDATETAFKLFQKANGLTADGIAGSDLDILYSDDAISYEDYKASIKENDEKETKKDNSLSFSLGDTGKEIKRIETRLIQLGYLSGNADEEFDSATEQAIKDFQKANGLEVTGIADEETQKLLFSNSFKSNDKKLNEESKNELKPVQTHIEVKKVTKEPAKSQSSEFKTLKTSPKALSNLTDKLGFEDRQGNNFGFIFWLLVTILVLTISLITVYIIERKRNNKKHKTSIHRFN